MTIELPEEKWTEFLNDLSRRRHGWTTRVEVLDPSVGNQVLSDGLPLGGITLEKKNGGKILEIALGETAARHQFHMLENPSKIAYLENEGAPGGVLEIEAEAGVKTLIHLIDAMPVYFGYASYKIVAAT